MTWIGRACVGLTFFALAVAVVCPSSVSGEDVESLLQKGNELRRRGRDREALAEFQRAAQISPTARVTAQVALAEQALGLWVEAETDLTKALADRRDTWIAKNRSVLDGALTTIREHVGTVEIWGAPDGAEVLLDDRVVGHLPDVGPISFATEDVELAVRAPGYVQLSRSLHVQNGSAIREHVDLRRVPLAEVPIASAPATPIPVAAQIASTPPTAAAVESERAPIYRRWWFWSGVGAVVVGAATFLVLSRTGGSTQPCPAGVPAGQCFPSP